MSFIAMPLSAFPKTFGITELKKGYFPHLFNRMENQDYVGPVPAKDYYLPETMSVEGRKAFETWHDQQRANQVVFNFAEELIAYCKSDVRLLKEGCLTFKDVWSNYSTFNPFDCITIAAACNRDLRENHMIKDSIASEPTYGWKLNMNQSLAAKEWLTWQENQLRQTALENLSPEDLEAHDLMAMAYPDHDHPSYRNYLQTGENCGEFTIPETNFKVDGYDPDTKTVYEFNGCFWHGCPKCYPIGDEKHQRFDGRTFFDVHELTKHRVQKIKSKGFQVVEIWECEWRQMKATNPDIQEFVKRLEFTDALNPRDAFCGGRTNAAKLYHQVNPTEKIYYLDYTGLYPWLNKTACYPKGHPTFISQPGTVDIRRYFGFVKCKILPPHELYPPVLPYHHNGLLTFPLCAKGLEEEMEKPVLQRSATCHHTPEERCLIGTWCTPELDKAVEMGYEVQYIYEVWHFNERVEGLFEHYVNNWLKLKQEASGWPEWVGNDEDKKQQYIRDYHQKEGILLNYDNIKYNPGLRAVAKIALNSMWGKFG